LKEEIEKIATLAGAQRNHELTLRLKRFEEQIAKPAANLATKMKCSTQDYHWSWLSDTSKLLMKHMLNDHDCVDLQTHRRMTKDDFHDLPQDAVIGDLILPIYPFLYRHDKSSDTRTMIKKGLVLVNIYSNRVAPENLDSPLFT
jgi:hypothetical protein